jgi:hypothetical protein
MQLTIKVALIGAVCSLLASCALPPLTGDLKSAREACNRDYPRRIGNYLPNARCVNAAIEAYALPAARHPDLVRMQEEIRASLSEKIDRRRLSVPAAERRMAEADRLVTQAERERDAGNNDAASRRIAAVEKLLRE